MALLHGFHREAYPNGDSYEGQFKKGARHGAGTYYDAGGPHYEGEFCEGMMEGAGTYYYHKNEVYKGQWHESKRHGAGRFQYFDGAVYDGQWEDDMRHGTGSMSEADGSVFEGQWEYDERSGEGKVTFADGGKYQGLWARNRRHGFGVMQLENGSSYNGQFKDDIAEGEGVLYDNEEKSQYSGQFKAGVRSGEGRCEFMKTNEKFSGVWVNNQKLSGHMFLVSGEVEGVGFLNDKLIRREKLSQKEQKKVIAKENGDPLPPDEDAPAEEKAEDAMDKTASMNGEEPAQGDDANVDLAKKLEEEAAKKAGNAYNREKQIEPWWPHHRSSGACCDAANIHAEHGNEGGVGWCRSGWWFGLPPLHVKMPRQKW